jgi:serine/threonine-protein kinase RsbW
MENERSSIELDLPAQASSVPTARHAVSELAERVGADASAARIVVSELVGNAVLHAYIEREPGPVLVLARITRGRLIVTVADQGRGMVPRLDSPGLGVGLPIAGKLARDVRIEADGGGTIVSASFDVEAPDPEPLAERSGAAEREIERARSLLRRPRRGAPRRAMALSA